VPTAKELLQSGAFNASEEEVDSSLTLPRECFIAQDFYELEIDNIWSREWVCVGHTSQIPRSGDYICVDIGNEPLVVVRDESGVIRCMSAVCRHRSMVFAEQSGTCKYFTCNYHGWRYSLAGKLVAAPNMGRTAGFDRSSVHLPQIPVDVWQGFIFVTLASEQPEPVAQRFGELDALLAGYAPATLVAVPPRRAEFPFNWKLYMQGAMECYHCSYLHPGQHDCAPTRNTQPELLPDHPYAIVVTVRTTHADASFVPPDYTIQFPPLPELSSEDRGTMRWLGILPNLLVSCFPDSVKYTIMRSLGPELTLLEFGWLYPPSVIADPDFSKTFTEVGEVVSPMIEQDTDACRRVQRGLHSSLSTRGRRSWQEQTVDHFDKWVLRRYREG
jgi:phenylpropionate dioxygenase-like ring-hydroxylating dioxygenase large terminal subunit